MTRQSNEHSIHGWNRTVGGWPCVPMSHGAEREGLRVAVFDLDGTLVETDEANTAAYLDALGGVGLRGVAAVRGRLALAGVRRLAKGIPAGDLEEIRRRKVEAYVRHLARTRLAEGARGLRHVLARRDIFAKVVLLTDSGERRAQETLRHHGLAGCFDEVVCNGGIGEKYANYFRDFDPDPAACVVWENEGKKNESAMAAGVKRANIRKVG